MGRGLFISFEGTEGSGKSTQIPCVADRLTQLGFQVRHIREPGGTPIGEEIRHTLQHSARNQAMTREAELLLLSASRAQLVREIIRPALAAGEVVLCDRFYDSTVAYQGYGRGIDLAFVTALTEFAVGNTRPDLTLLLRIPVALSEERRRSRHLGSSTPPDPDRMEQADRDFFQRVECGFDRIAEADPQRVKVIDAAGPMEMVAGQIWEAVQRLMEDRHAGMASG